MSVKAVAKMISETFIKEDERLAERCCSQEIAVIARELEILKGICGSDGAAIGSIMLIDSAVGALADRFEQTGFEKGFLYGVAFFNEMTKMGMDDI